MSAAVIILALALVGAMAPSASAQSILLAVQNGSTIEYGGATYPIVDNKVTISARVYRVGPGGVLIWCDTCTPAPGGGGSTGGTTGGTTTCPTTPPADRCLHDRQRHQRRLRRLHVLDVRRQRDDPGEHLSRRPRRLSYFELSAPRPAAPPAGPRAVRRAARRRVRRRLLRIRSYVTVSGTNAIYGGCSYAMSGSYVTILGSTYIVGPGGLADPDVGRGLSRLHADMPDNAPCG